ncbi:MAG: DUF2945 domain-containing protein [Cytophagales bacterium]|jgi:hypothetical protein|nr:DUF2945 domain-containing protein [Cytophagales bacterium]
MTYDLPLTTYDWHTSLVFWAKNLKNMKKGAKVQWKWGNGTAHGKVVETHKEPVERTIKGEKIKRNGSPENPALLIEQDDGDQVLKLASEVSEG